MLKTYPALLVPLVEGKVVELLVKTFKSRPRFRKRALRTLETLSSAPKDDAASNVELAKSLRQLKKSVRTHWRAIADTISEVLPRCNSIMSFVVVVDFLQDLLMEPALEDARDWFAGDKQLLEFFSLQARTIKASMLKQVRACFLFFFAVQSHLRFKRDSLSFERLYYGCACVIRAVASSAGSDGEFFCFVLCADFFFFFFGRKIVRNAWVSCLLRVSLTRVWP
jgi:hypothetical protein